MAFTSCTSLVQGQANQHPSIDRVGLMKFHSEELLVADVYWKKKNCFWGDKERIPINTQIYGLALHAHTDSSKRTHCTLILKERSLLGRIKVGEV